MFYPQNVGNWSRQVQQNLRQWVYKPVHRTWSQTPFDHITIQLVKDGETSDCDGNFHYTTRGGATFNTVLGSAPRNGQSLVYVYDYKINFSTGIVTRSNQTNHNEYRFPKLYVSDVNAAQVAIGAPQINAQQDLLKNYNDVGKMKEVDTLAKEFWAAFPRTAVSIFGSFPSDSKKFDIGFRFGIIECGVVETDSASGQSKFWGASVTDNISFKCSRFDKDWIKIRRDTSVMDSGGRYSILFS